MLVFIFGLNLNICGSDIGSKFTYVFLEEPGFPTVETEVILFSHYKSLLKDQQKNLNVQKTSFADFHQLLADKTKIDLLIWPYGSAMTDRVWVDILHFLQNGGNILVTGGRPFSFSVDETSEGYRLRDITNRFTEQLHIFEAYPISVEGKKTIVRNPEFDFLPILTNLHPKKAYSLLTFSGTDLLPEGLWGNLSSKFSTLVSATDSTDISTIPLISCMDRYHSDFVGGRWVFLTFTPQVGYWSTAGGKNLLRKYSLFATQKPVEIDIVPDYAFYHPGEKAGFEIRLKSFHSNSEKFQLEIKVTCDGKMVENFSSIPISDTDTLVHLTLDQSVKEGLYRMDLTLKEKNQVIEKRVGGFVVGDLQQLNTGLPFTTNSHFLKRGDKTYPVVGMTYMASDKQRYFLKYPNPVVWDRDMKEMKELGINMLRTGLWKLFPQELFMDSLGQPNEQTLRSLDAWFYTAKKYDLPVQYCLFPFQPQVHGSEAPFTDAEAFEVQRQYLTIFAQRYQNNPDLIWDLMNEPTYGKDSRLWSGNVPTDSESEKALWNEWLQNQYGSSLNQLPGMVNSISSHLMVDGKVRLPVDQDLVKSNIYEKGQKPLLAYDYNLFAQFAFNQWAGIVRTIFREAGSYQLIATGMDEGGVTNRILAPFYAETSDFTNQHSWWQDDDLLWDNLMAKTPLKPLLVQETNLMRYTDLREKGRRNESDYMKTLERKLCIGLGAEGAGVIPWLWTANTLLSENESSIGIYRSDGTASPERAMYKRFVKFVTANADYFSATSPTDILLVSPNSLQFTNLQPLAVTATKNAVRAMHYYTRLSFVVAGEYHLEQVKQRPKLIILPSAQVLSDQAWFKLCTWVSEGATLLVTGPIDRNPHFESVERLSGMGVDLSIAPILEQHALLNIGNEQLSLDFYNTKAMQSIDKMVWANEQGQLKKVLLGTGKILMTEYPVELNTNLNSLSRLYHYAAEAAGVDSSFTTDCTNPGILIRPIDYEKARLYVLESETNQDVSFTISDHRVHQSYPIKLEAGRAKLLLISKLDGKMIDQY